MTTDRAIEILKQRECCRECVADCTCDECDNAFDMAIKALDEVERYKKAIEEVKAEILSLKGDNFPNGYYVKIIDKHIKEVES